MHSELNFENIYVTGAVSAIYLAIWSLKYSRRLALICNLFHRSINYLYTRHRIIIHNFPLNYFESYSRIESKIACNMLFLHSLLCDNSLKNSRHYFFFPSQYLFENIVQINTTVFVQMNMRESSLLNNVIVMHWDHYCICAHKL